MCINSIDILNCDYFKQNAINVNINREMKLRISFYVLISYLNYTRNLKKQSNRLDTCSEYFLFLSCFKGKKL